MTSSQYIMHEQYSKSHVVCMHAYNTSSIKHQGIHMDVLSIWYRQHIIAIASIHPRKLQKTHHHHYSTCRHTVHTRETSYNVCTTSPISSTKQYIWTYFLFKWHRQRNITIASFKLSKRIENYRWHIITITSYVDSTCIHVRLLQPHTVWHTSTNCKTTT